VDLLRSHIESLGYVFVPDCSVLKTLQFAHGNKPALVRGVASPVLQSVKDGLIEDVERVAQIVSQIRALRSSK
jgi:hypothetical protein